MSLKKLVVPIFIGSFMQAAHSGVLPEDPCSSLAKIIEGCKVTADQQDSDALGRGINHIKLYPHEGALLAANGKQPALDKLFIFVAGFDTADVSHELYPNPETTPSYDPFAKYSPMEIGLSTLNMGVDKFGNKVAIDPDVSVLIVKQPIVEHETMVDGAYALQSTLELIQSYRNDNKPIVVAGYSIGGVISRYALADLESKNVEHNTALYISYDAPHRGVHVPQSIQNVLPLMQDYKDDIARTSNDVRKIPFIGKFAANVLDALAAKVEGVDSKFRAKVAGMSANTLSSKAGEQFVIDHVLNPSAQEAMFTQLNSIKYPGDYIDYSGREIRTIAVTNGDLQGFDQTDELQRYTNGAYFRFRGEKGSTDIYAFLDFQLFPTTPNKINVSNSVGGYASKTFYHPCFPKIWLTCSSKLKAELDWPHSRTAHAEVKQLDLVSGGYVDIGSFLIDGVDDVADSGIFDRIPDDKNWRKVNKFTFLPTYSALDVEAPAMPTVFDVAATPFDRVMHSVGNQVHTEIDFELDGQALLDEIRDALSPLSPPATTMNAFITIGDAKMDVIYNSLCKSVVLASSNKNNSLPQAMNEINKARDSKLPILLNQGAINQQEYDDTYVWLDALTEQLVADAAVYAVEVPEVLASFEPSYSCNK
ncbi:MAG: hypothetical protein HRU20_23750 [Pseudomonadales bacterium]|nr:hypothetical protein [Pseudomonadales bacterium]